MALTLLEALNRTRAPEVRVRLDQVEEALGKEKAEKLNFGTVSFQETTKVSTRSVIKPEKRVKVGRLGLFDRQELVDALKKTSSSSSKESRPNALPSPDSK